MLNKIVVTAVVSEILSIKIVSEFKININN